MAKARIKVRQGVWAAFADGPAGPGGRHSAAALKERNSHIGSSSQNLKAQSEFKRHLTVLAIFLPVFFVALLTA